MTDYSKMSDFEISHMVSQKLPGRYITYADHVMDSETEETFDPCNKPADAWPIIAERKICLAFDVFAEPQDGGGWVASPAYGWESERTRHDNPLRAAMILFLMMQEKSK